MLKKIKSRIGALIANREVLLYLVFGVLTTLVDWVISFALYRTDLNLHLANTIAWCAAVLFAYVTNRVWVFESPRRVFLPVTAELLGFAGARVATLLMQEAIFFLFCDLLGVSEYLIKLVAAVLVVVGNYIISKLLVFRKR